MAEPGCFVSGGEGVQGGKVHGVPATGIRIHINVACVEGGEVLEEVRALGRVHAEVRQGAFHQHAGLGDVAPGYRNAQGGDAGAPSAKTNKDILFSGRTELGIERTQFLSHLHGFHFVKGRCLQVHHVLQAFQPAGAQGALRGDERTGTVDVSPVHIRLEAVGRYGPDLQGVECAC